MSTTVNVLETKIGGTFTGESAGTLDLSKLPDYGAGSSVVLAPDGKGVIRNGKYTSLEPGANNMSGSERNELRSNAAANTKLLLAQQELEENGTPIAETLGLKMPGDDNYDRDDRERIQEAENAASVLLREQSDLDYHKYLERQSDDGPSAIEIHNQIFGGGGNAPGTVKQDENGNWYAVKQLDNSNALGRDYSIDPKDNSAGPTFGANVSKDIEEMFPNEVAAAGGSSDFEGSIKDIFKDTDVPSQGYTPVSTPTPQGNSFMETMANIFTPFNDTTYENGVLVSKTTGFPVSSDSDIAAGQEFAESMKGAGILGISGKQIPDAPFYQGNTPILTYTGGDKDTRSYEVFGGLDPNAPARMSYNEDGSLFVPYGGKDSYSFDASTNFPGSTDPNSPDYNMSKDLAESGSYFGFKFDESGKIPLQDTKGNYIIDTSRKIESSPFKDGDFPEFPLNPIAELNEIGKAHLLATGDDSKMIVKGPGGSYEYINGDPVIDPNTGLPVTPYDPTGGGPIFVQDPGGGIVLVDPVTLEPPYTTFDPPRNPPPVNPPPVNPPPVNPPPVNPPPVNPPPVNPTDPITNPGGFNSSFYGGYQPVTASDVLIPNANATDTYFQPREARLNPMFPQGNLEPYIIRFPMERQGIRSLFDEPASAAMYQGIMS